VLLTVGIIDFGRVMWTATTIEHVAREAARYASVHGEGSITVATETSVANFAAGRATGLDQAELNVVVTYEGNSNISGNTVTVEVDYDFVLILGGLLGFDPVALESSSTFTII
jgi:Flp pilus assembly protein TadG